MGELDGLVLDAIEATALSPVRLRKLAETLVARTADRNAAPAARLKALNGERRNANVELAELYRLLGTQTLALDATLAAHVKALHDTVETATRQIALLESERAASAALRNPDNPAFARACIQAVVSAVIASATV